MIHFDILEIDFKLGSQACFKIHNSRTDYLMLMLRKDPCSFERNVVILFYHLCKKSGLTIVDVGANIGIYSILAARIQPGCRVDAFEPSPANLRMLQENIHLNGINEISIISKALGSQTGEATLFIPTDDEISSVASLVDGFTALFHDNIDNVTVGLDTLDNHYAGRLDSIDLVKIDAEFYENEILYGGQQLIQHSRPIVICEALFYEVHRHKFAHPKKIHDERHSYNIESFFKERDYLMYAIGLSGILRIDNLHHHPDDRNFLFLPYTKQLESIQFIPYNQSDFIELVNGGITKNTKQ